MAIQNLGIRATCTECGEQQVAGSEKELVEKCGWIVETGKVKRCYCSRACNVTFGQKQLRQDELMLDQAGREEDDDDE
jgi:hypothetical protein